MALVTIGIPTYNGAATLRRAIQSALQQDFLDIEVIVSDNASTDETEEICRGYLGRDPRFKYVRQPINRGPAANFSEVLDRASGQYFMWLGDDDWIDHSYISSCLEQFRADPSVALVSGNPEYYRSGVKSHDGGLFSLLQDAWWRRVIAYYENVTDNGMFYGIMPTGLIRRIVVPVTMGGDWMMLANIAATGKVLMLPHISVHREMGGMSASYHNIASTAGLPKIQARFPLLCTALGVCRDILATGTAFRSRPILQRSALATAVFAVILLKYKNGVLASTFRAFYTRLLVA